MPGKGKLHVRVIEGIDLYRAPRGGKKRTSIKDLREAYEKTKDAFEKTLSAVGIGDSQEEAKETPFLVLKVGSKTVKTTPVLFSTKCQWNEDFLFDDVLLSDELRVTCLDRRKVGEPMDDSSGGLGDGYLGHVDIPVSRLPPNDKVEQWYQLMAESNAAITFGAVRLSLSFEALQGEGGDSKSSEETLQPRSLAPLIMASPPSTNLTPPALVNVLTPENGVTSSVEEVTPRPSEDSRPSSTASTPGNRLWPASYLLTPGNRPDSNRSPARSPLRRSHRPQKVVLEELPPGLIDYFAVVGLAPGPIGPPPDSCPTRAFLSPASTTDSILSEEVESIGGGSSAELEPVVLDRFPLEDHPPSPLPTKLEWFCFPAGLKVVRGEKPPKPGFNSFVLIGGSEGAQKTYVAAFTYFVVSSSNAELSLGSGPDNGGGAGGGASQASDRSGDEAWAPRCLCLLSRYPFLKTLEDMLLTIYSCMQLSEDQTYASVEDYLHYIIWNVPAPIPGVLSVQIELEGDRKRFSLPEPDDLPHLSVGMSSLFQRFLLKDVLTLIGLVLFECKIVLHSSSPELLTEVAETLTALIYPFQWHHPYIPVLPQLLSEYIQAPLPFILGVQSEVLEETLISEPENLVLVDVDKGELRELKGLPPLPPAHTKMLYNKLHEILFPVNLEGSPAAHGHTHSPAHSEPSGWQSDALGDTERFQEELDSGQTLEIRWAFCEYFASLLYGYRDCLFFLDEGHPIFNKKRFLKSFAAQSSVPFLSKLVDSQAFVTFLDNLHEPRLMAFHALVADYRRRNQSKRLAADSATVKLRTELEDRHGKVPLLIVPPPYRELSTREMRAPHSNQSAKDELNIEQSAFATPQSSTSGTASKEKGDLGEGGVQASADRQPTSSSERAPAQESGRILQHGRLAAKLRKVWTTKEVAALLGVQESHFTVDFPSGRNILGRNNLNEERELSPEQQAIEETLQRAIAKLFASEPVSEDEVKNCEGSFNSQYARDLFALILHQPQQRVKESSQTVISIWGRDDYKGSALNKESFDLLTRLSRAMLHCCETFHDYANARVVLQAASGYYLSQGTQASGTRVYLQEKIRKHAICRNLVFWEHAFSDEMGLIAEMHELERQSDPSSQESKPKEQVIFEQAGALIFDMLNVGLPVHKVKAFVQRICAVCAMDPEYGVTLAQLVTNVDKAIRMSSVVDTKLSAGFDRMRKESVITISRHIDQTPTSAPTAAENGGRKERSDSWRGYDLDSVIRRHVGGEEAFAGEKEDETSVTNRDGASVITLMGSSLPAHKGPVLCLDLSNGRVASGGTDKTVAVWDLKDRVQIHALSGHTGPINCIQFNDSYILSGSFDKTLRLYNLKGATTSTWMPPSMKPPKVSVKVMKGHQGAVLCAQALTLPTADPESLLMLSGSNDATLRIWTGRSGKCRSVLAGHSASVNCLAVNSTVNVIASGSRDSVVCLWDPEGGRLVAKLKGHENWVRDVQINKEVIVSASNDRTVKVWDHRAAKACGTLRGHSGPVHCLLLGGPLDPTVVSGSADGTIRVWDLRYAGRASRLMLTGHTDKVTCIKGDFTKLFSGSDDKSVKIWDLQTGDCLHTCYGHSLGVSCVGFEERRIVSGSWDSTINVWFVDEESEGRAKNS